jgi:hypothetical protein
MTKSSCQDHPPSLKSPTKATCEEHHFSPAKAIRGSTHQALKASLPPNVWLPSQGCPLYVIHGSHNNAARGEDALARGTTCTRGFSEGLTNWIPFANALSTLPDACMLAAKVVVSDLPIPTCSTEFFSATRNQSLVRETFRACMLDYRANLALTRADCCGSWDCDDHVALHSFIMLFEN